MWFHMRRRLTWERTSSNHQHTLDATPCFSSVAICPDPLHPRSPFLSFPGRLSFPDQQIDDGGAARSPLTEGVVFAIVRLHSGEENDRRTDANE